MQIVNTQDLEDYLSNARARGVIDKIQEAKEWADYMEIMLDNYKGPPLPMDFEELSAEGLAFLLNFWSYRDQLLTQVTN